MSEEARQENYHDAEPIFYDPHAVEPVIFALEAKDFRATPDFLVRYLWHSFAFDAARARTCPCGCEALRTNLGNGGDITKIATLFQSVSALPSASLWQHTSADPYANLARPVPSLAHDPLSSPESDPFAVLARIGFQAGIRGEADMWLSAHLNDLGWTIHDLWAVTRKFDLRHRDCSWEECQAS